MSVELDCFNTELADIFFGYAHITGAIELYMMALETKKLQLAISESLFDVQQEWTQVHRFMTIDGKQIEWYPALPTEKVVAQKDALLGSMYGIYLSKMIGCIDSYLSSVLQSKRGHTEKSGSSWEAFSSMMKIDLLQCTNGSDIYLWIQERNKIEHNKAKIDQTFVDRMLKKGITHSYSKSDSIQKSHLDVLATRNAMIEFVADLDQKVNPSTK
jgi:hypothetical protein